MILVEILIHFYEVNPFRFSNFLQLLSFISGKQSVTALAFLDRHS